MNEYAQKIKDTLTARYRDEEWPALLRQTDEWSVTRPLEGLRILDATPLYSNTLGKFMALLAAGAEVYVPWRYQLPLDQSVLDRLGEYGVKRARRGDDNFDIVLDCSGQCAQLHPTLGFCELTRSGVPRYERVHSPVFIVDSSRIKRIEAVLGTGESFFRALSQLGHSDVEGRRLLVVGYGKVGHGITYYARKNGMKITVADEIDKSGELPGDVAFVNTGDPEAFREAVLHSWCVVTATGKISALRHKLDAPAVIESPVLLANMGVEDEYGSAIPNHRVLNNKHPLNFILDDPTSMRFIDATMALHNACALELLIQDLPHRALSPSPDIEKHILDTVREKGIISSDLEVVNSEAL